MLHRRDLFCRLTETAWDERRARNAIRAVVADVESACRGPDRLWPADPVSAATADPVASVYAGAAGTVFALESLRRRGLAETQLDLCALARAAIDRFRSAPDFRNSELEVPEPEDAALLTGETGILLIAWWLAPAEDLADALHANVRANVANPADEVMWGTPGTLLAAAAMLEWTGEERWRSAAQDSAEALLARRDDDGLWTQRLYGTAVRGVGPLHGAVGNVEALARVVDPETRARLERETSAALARTAIVEDGLANWPSAASAGPPELLRWCAGAPGILASATAYLEEELVLAAAELVWRAGAVRMASGGPGICCGTAGNGYALLKVFEHTGDERWLERARRFATHALEQVERDRARGGPGWHSLWAGDPGVALFAADCLDGRGAYPLFDAASLRLP